MSAGILIDLTPASGAHGVRGIGSYVRGLAIALEAADPGWRPRLAALVGRDMHAPPGVVRSLSSPMRDWRAQDVGWLSGWMEDSRAMRRVDVRAFHLTDPRRPFLPAPARRSIATAYDLIPLESDVARKIRFHRRLIHRAYLRTLQHASRVVAISATTASLVSERLDIDPSTIDVVYPVVVAPTDPITERAALSEPIFLFVGVPDGHKRPELAIAAIAAFRRRHGVGRLRFLGPLTGVHRQRLASEARRARVSEAVSFEGTVSATELETAYRSVTALLAVSRLEGFGLPPVEAALRGAPVIAVDTPVARETLGSAAQFVGDDPEAIGDAMAAPVPPTPESREWLRDRYSAPAVAIALTDSYRRVLDG